MMKKNMVCGIFSLLPFGLSLIAVYMQSVWMIVATALLMFVLVSLLPVCHKRENLWIFIMTAFASIPINVYILKSSEFWSLLLPTERDVIYYLTFVQYVLVLSSAEEILTGTIGRLIWRRQYKLFLPVEVDDE